MAAASFADYISSLPAALSEIGSSTSLHVTVGNESCDLDSMVCALGHAHFLHSRLSPEGVVSLPLFQCSRADFSLRPEAVWLFQEKLGLDTTKFIFIDDVTSDTLSSVGKLALTLVDHNAPTGFLKEFVLSIAEVIDHHRQVREEGRWKTTLEKVGSCSTLVAQKLLAESSYAVESSVALMLLSAILLDTVNLDPDFGKTTDKDVEMVEKLRPIAGIDGDDLYTELSRKAFSVSHLSTPQLLRMDHKKVKVGHFTLGFSTIKMLLSELLLRDDISADIHSFCSMSGLHAIILFGISVSETTGEKRRQIAVTQLSGAVDIPHDLVDSLVSILEIEKELECERETLEGTAFDGILLEQHNIKMSRKRILPLLADFLRTIEDDDPLVRKPDALLDHPNFGSGAEPSRSRVLEPEPETGNEPPEHPNFAAMETPPHETTPPTAAVVAVSTSGQPVPLEPAVTVVTPPQAQGSKGRPVADIPEYTTEEEAKQSRTYRHIAVGGEEMTISMAVVQPYRAIIQHAGYIGSERRAVVVISACYLPPRSIPNYHQVTNHLFFYLLSVLDKLVVDDYMIVYLHSGAPRNGLPSLKLLHKFYQMVDRRLRKQLMELYIVHPTFWVKTALRLARPFISTKFWRKVRFIGSLQELSSHVTLEAQFIPAPVLNADSALHASHPPREKYSAPAQAAEEEGK